MPRWSKRPHSQAHERSSFGLVIVLGILGCALIVVALLAGGPSRPPAPIMDAGPGSPARSPSVPTETTRQPSPNPSDPTPSTDLSPRAQAAPVWVDIPNIGVSSPLLKLGLQSDGTVEVPEMRQADQAGWYRYSPTPGEKGPAVIIGHVDSKTGPAVFFELGSLKKNDRVKVERADGQVAIFSVDEVAAYDKENFPTSKVYGDIDHAGLRLITCGGTYDQESGGYQANTVVFASLLRIEEAQPRKS